MSTPVPLRVAVIGGGENDEHDVSLASAASVRRALADRADVVELTIDRDGSWRDARGPLPFAAAVLALQGCDVVFPAVHGPRGEDGALAALLEFARVRYVGSGPRAGALAMDKRATKLIAESVGVRTAGDATPGEFPVVVKPVAAGSSVGVALARDENDLAGAIETARAHDDLVLIEPFVAGREIDIAVLTRGDGSRILSAPLEIVVGGDLFDTATKYDGTAEFRVPAELTDAQRTELERQALLVHDALGCAGVARIDFFLRDPSGHGSGSGSGSGENGFVLNEVNTMPGMTEHSQVPRMFAAVGLPYENLLDELLEAAVR